MSVPQKEALSGASQSVSYPQHCTDPQSKPRSLSEYESSIVLRGMRFHDNNEDGIATFAEQQQRSSFSIDEQKAFRLLAGMGDPCHKDVIDKSDLEVIENNPGALAQLISSELSHASEKNQITQFPRDRYDRLVSYTQIAFNMLYRNQPFGTSSYKRLKVDGVYGTDTAAVASRFRQDVGIDFKEPNSFHGDYGLDKKTVEYIEFYLNTDPMGEIITLLQEAKHGNISNQALKQLPQRIKSRLVNILRYIYPAEIPLESASTSEESLVAAENVLTKHFGGTTLSKQRLLEIHRRLLSKPFSLTSR